MLWLRKGIVHLLAFVLLISLLGIAAATSFDKVFSSPNRLENWLSESNIYSQVIPNALSNAQVASSQDGSEGSVSLNDPGVKQAAAQSFSSSFLQQSVNAFLTSNYAWLKGQTTKPQFSINLTAPKQQFANQIGQQVQSHLTSLPVCSETQLAQLQFPVDPLTVSCRPPTLDPITESQQVTQDINSSGDFLGKTVITADNVGQSQPYYKKLSWLPSTFRLVLKLPYILTLVAVVMALGIIVMAPTRRKGERRVGFTLLTAGIILLIVSFVANTIINKVENKAFTQTFSDQLKQPYHDLLELIKSSLVHTDVWFGAIFVILALIIFILLIVSRRRKNTPPKTASSPREPASTPETEESTRTPGLANSKPPTSPTRPISSNSANDIRLAPRRAPIDVKTAPVRQTSPPLSTSGKEPLPTLKKPHTPKRPPRLIQ